MDDRFLFHVMISFFLGICIGGARLKVIPGFILMLIISLGKEYFDIWYLKGSGFSLPPIDEHISDVMTNMLCALGGFLIVNNLISEGQKVEKKIPDELIKHYEKKRRIARLNRVRRGIKSEI